MVRTDIAVVGGGAAGLMAALSTARQLKSDGSIKKVLLLEGNSRVGKKILATGNGRCNLSNENLRAKAYFGGRDNVEKILLQCGVRDIEEMFADMGLLCRGDESGRMYPANLQAAAVLKSLRAACEENGVDCCCDAEILSVSRQKQGFMLKSGANQEFFTKKLILACGGKASPMYSCGQKGYELAELLGHTVTEAFPALAQLRCSDGVARSLKGLRSRARASLKLSGEIIASESGEVIFNDGALSGICIFDLSVVLADMLSRAKLTRPFKNVKVSLDLAEDMPTEALLAHFRRIQKNMPNMPVKDILSGAVNIRVGEAVLKQLSADMMKPVTGLGSSELRMIAAELKNFEFQITDISGWEQSQVTVGGVPLDELDSATMESKRCRGLYMAGEMLEPAGKCGGFNLHFAWATGMIAGKNAAKDIIYV